MTLILDFNNFKKNPSQKNLQKVLNNNININNFIVKDQSLLHITQDCNTMKILLFKGFFSSMSSNL